jgi:hypothetical protein
MGKVNFLRLMLKAIVSRKRKKKKKNKGKISPPTIILIVSNKNKNNNTILSVVELNFLKNPYIKIPKIQFVAKTCKNDNNPVTKNVTQ